jgi:DNA-binding NarL/FixJ family response regulator
MSKQRPSTAITEPTGGPQGRGADDPSPGYWRRRLFKNTYTRNGRCIEVKGWSVKIQVGGTRRTFSLSAKGRTAAAIEARAIYQTVLSEGWDAAVSMARKGSVLSRTQIASQTESLAKTDSRYWKHRLLRRRHPAIGSLAASGGLSARIEHAGVSRYFPLGSALEDSAAAQAREIYQAVVNDGWDAVGQRFPREVTVALHWADNPLAWTYVTIHTVVEDLLARSEPRTTRKSPRATVAIVEPDDGVRRALWRCVNSEPGLSCVATFAGAKDAFREIPRCTPRLALVNRALPDCTPAEFMEKLYRLAPAIMVLFFTTYEDSDQLFKATPGGASGYLLKRTAPDRLFEPIMELLEKDTLSADRIALHVRRYFQNVIASLSADDATHEMAGLTHREHEILNLLSKGYVDKEIAENLGISVWTVHGHLKKIFEKLGVHTRTEAAIKYLHK